MNAMIYRTLGTTGLTVSAVGVGTWQLGGEWGVSFSASDVDAILGTAAEAGINLIDTAECYGDHRAETLVGARLRHEREHWIVATKFGHHFHGHMDRTRHFDPREVEKQLASSLAALKTDYVDVLQFHSPTDEEFFNDDLWDALARLKERGMVRHLGLSVSKNTNLRQVAAVPESGGETLQIIYNRVDRAPEGDVFDAATAAGLGVFARVPLASGFLTGKYGPETVFPESDWRSRMDPEKRARILAEVEEIRRDELPEGAPMAQWALAWPLRHPAVTCVIPGCKGPDQVRSNARAIEWVPEPEAHPQATASPA